MRSSKSGASGTELCGNTHELLEAYYGVLLAGGVLLPLNIRLSPADLRSVLARSGATVLFRHPAQPDPGADVPEVVLGPDYEAAHQRRGVILHLVPFLHVNGWGTPPHRAGRHARHAPPLRRR